MAGKFLLQYILNMLTLWPDMNKYIMMFKVMFCPLFFLFCALWPYSNLWSLCLLEGSSIRSRALFTTWQAAHRQWQALWSLLSFIICPWVCTDTSICMCCNLTKTLFMEDMSIVSCGGGKECKFEMQLLLNRQHYWILVMGIQVRGQTAAIEGCGALFGNICFWQVTC